MTNFSKQHLSLVVVLLFFFTHKASSYSSFQHYRIGNQESIATFHRSGFLLAGGGTDVDSGMRWLMEKADGGDVLVIRAEGSDDYNDYLATLKQTNSVETLVIPSRLAAEEPYVLRRVKEAEAIFIAGGGQNDYINFWKGTSLNEALNQAIATGVAIGGTSAGLAVLGEYIYDAKTGSATSQQALQNPYSNSISFSTQFLYIPVLKEVITDSHFVARDRMGRLLTYLSRLIEDGYNTRAFGIGIDERTNLIVESNGMGKVLGSGKVYFLKQQHPAKYCQQGKPLELSPVSVYRLGKSGSFDLMDWIGSEGLSYELSVSHGNVISTQSSGNIY